MSIDGFTLALTDLRRVGKGLRRPENVLAFRDGTVFTSSNSGYLSRIDPDGHQVEIGAIPDGQPTTMALEDDASILVNNTADGNVYRLGLDGHHELVLDAIDGEPLGSANHVFRDSRGRTWIAVATRRRPPHQTIHVESDGYIALMDEHGVRIVADGLRWPNEVRLDHDERYAYVSETFGRRIVRFPIGADGAAGEIEVVGPDPLGEATLPDGIALDRDGNVWVATVSRNGLMIITPDGQSHVVFEQPVPEALDELSRAYASGRVPLPGFAACAGPELRLLTSIGFGGPDLTTVYMGSLAMSELLSFESPVPGLPLQHQHRATAPPQPV